MHSRVSKRQKTLLLLTALLTSSCITGTAIAGQRINLGSSKTTAGAKVALTGSGFSKKKRVKISFNGATIKTVRATKSGRISTKVSVPKTAAVGTSQIKAGKAKKNIKIVAAARIVAAGDISCASTATKSGTNCQQMETSQVALDANPDAALLLGDNQYELGALSEYQLQFDPSWGRLKAITKPAPGNHEYYTANAAGYFDYFGDAAGDRSKGYYSFDVGAWHMVAINTNNDCAVIGCSKNSQQGKWLKKDLAKNTTACTLVYWHHPRFSSGEHGNNPTMQDLWEIVTEADVELVLNGHDHNYERFTTMDKNGKKSSKGTREIVVGTGGKNYYEFPSKAPSTSEIRNDNTHGVLQVDLAGDSYSWQFLPVPGGTFTDSGSTDCH